MGFLVFIIVIITVVVVFGMLSKSTNDLKPAPKPFEPSTPQRSVRDQHDLNDMRSVPNARAEDIDGSIIWYEWTTQGRHNFHLAYWYNGSDYEAAVVDGVDPRDRDDPRKCHLFSDGRICLKGAGEAPYNSIKEVRARAILWSLGYSEYLRTGNFPWNKLS